MNFAALSDVKFGDQEGMKYFLLENGLQHQLFRANLLRQGVVPPSYPLIDVDFDAVRIRMVFDTILHAPLPALQRM